MTITLCGESKAVDGLLLLCCILDPLDTAYKLATPDFGDLYDGSYFCANRIFERGTTDVNIWPFPASCGVNVSKRPDAVLNGFLTVNFCAIGDASTYVLNELMRAGV